MFAKVKIGKHFYYTTMGLLSKIIRHTPFNNLYNSYNKKQNELAQKKLDQKLFPQRVNFYKNFIDEGDLVFDVGANVGNRVEAFLECKAKVVAVEPQPACVEILINKFGNRIIIENVGLNDEEGELEMQISTDTTISTFSKDYIETTKDRFKYSSYQGSIKVPVTTLDKLISKHGAPKFCKIDVEGFEFQVLKGLHQPIQYISLEYCVPELKTNLHDCINYIHGIAPSAVFNYSIGESMKWAYDDWKNFEDFQNHMNTSGFDATDFGDVYVKCF